MPDESNVIRGTCHCGAIEAEMRLSTPISEIALRRCGCSFCRRIGALAYSDPAGQALVDADADDLRTYQFGQEAADFLICRTCGVFVAAVSGDEKMLRCVLNVTGLAPEIAENAKVVPLEAAGEDKTGRRTRHAAKWTPVEFSDPAIRENLKTVALPPLGTGSR